MPRKSSSQPKNSGNGNEIRSDIRSRVFSRVTLRTRARDCLSRGRVITPGFPLGGQLRLPSRRARKLETLKNSKIIPALDRSISESIRERFTARPRTRENVARARDLLAELYAKRGICEELAYPRGVANERAEKMRNYRVTARISRLSSAKMGEHSAAVL